MILVPDLREAMPAEPLDEFGRLLSLAIEPRSDAWFALRAGRVTASRFKEACAGGAGKTADRYARQLACERLIGVVGGYTNSAMQRGADMEGEAMAYYMGYYDEEILPIGFVEMSAVAGATPDGWIGDDVVFELKCPDRHHVHAEYIMRDDVPPEYRAQVQGQMMVTGAHRCVFATYHPDFPDPYKIWRVVVQRDNAYIETMIDKLQGFCASVEKYYQELKLKGNA